MRVLVFTRKNNNVIETARKISDDVIVASFEQCEKCANFIPDKEIRSFEEGFSFIKGVEEKVSPEVIFFSDETIIRESASFFAGSRQLGLISHSNDVYIKNRKIIGVVPGWENLSAEVYSITKPVLLLVNTNGSIPYVQNSVDIIKIEKGMLQFEKSAVSEKNPLETAKVVIGIGRGVKKTLFPVIEKIAKKMGAEIGCTRPVADSGLMPLSRVIGDSGICINPKVYIALGISGAIQHTSCVNADYIISVNIDRNAPIFSISTLPVLAKVEEILPQLEKWIKNIS